MSMLGFDKQCFDMEEFHVELALMREVCRKWSEDGARLSFAATYGENDKLSVVMAHGYERIGAATKSYVLRVPTERESDDYEYVFSLRRAMTEETIAAGFPCTVDGDMPITHKFHLGDHPNKDNGISYISFGVRLSDEDAILMLIKQFTGYRLKAVDKVGE